jgi:hypothetical protein
MSEAFAGYHLALKVRNRPINARVDYGYCHTRALADLPGIW